MTVPAPPPTAVTPLWADSLTAGRAVLAVPLALVAGGGRWTAAALLLSGAWWSDFFDGRLARRATRPTRFGSWDLPADTIVGAGLGAGLVGGGHMPWAWGAVALVFGAGFVITGNEAHSMLLQAMAYGPALWFIGGESAVGLAVVLATIATIAVLDRARLFEYVLPSFFAGIRGRRQA